MKNEFKNHSTRKPTTKELIFKELVGCITIPIEEKITPEMVKSYSFLKKKKKKVS